ncbi:MAG: type II methionyl aminopeptidase, partial [archaeon]|nr:type II methionyl aminopeptidase [archaeon]
NNNKKEEDIKEEEIKKEIVMKEEEIKKESIKEEEIKKESKTNKKEDIPKIRENKYKSLIEYDPSIEINDSRFQDNSILRIVNDWKEEPNKNIWKQTNIPTKSIDEQYPDISMFPKGEEIQYGDKLIWRSTSKEKMEKEKDYTTAIQCLRKSGECHRQIRKYAQTLLKPGIKLIDFCRKLEKMLNFIINTDGTECGQAFPTGVSLNNCAAHYTPNSGDETVLTYDDVCKLDFGTHINGYIIDSAFTVAFNPIYDNLLMASKEATNTGIKEAGIDVRLGELGTKIEEVMTSYEVELNGKTYPIKPVSDLMGHTILPYRVHGGKSVPCIKSKDNTKMEEGEIYAIETFATTGKGLVREGKEWSHFMKDPYAFANTKIKKDQPKRLFKFIDKNFSTLAFCPRWIEEKGFKDWEKPLKYLCDTELVEPYPPLIDSKGSFTAQFEHTLMLRPTCKEVFSRGDDY